MHNADASVEHLRETIDALAELVQTLTPEATGIAEEREKALAAAGDGVTDKRVLQRFADWVLSTIGRGASAALIPVVTASTDSMLQEASRLTGHL
ncbi:hypothetical protein [Trebonia sp.]|uniref:hypothetical protein n=1 Tax=Trebonia sp. TaxID=2767075 RepID=UPI002612E655|nr:hypothetical protein [Trebonia sp.]